MGPVSPDLGFCVPSLAEPRSPEPLSFIGLVIIGEKAVPLTSALLLEHNAVSFHSEAFQLPLGELTAVTSHSEWLSSSVEISFECLVRALCLFPAYSREIHSKAC